MCLQTGGREEPKVKVRIDLSQELLPAAVVADAPGKFVNPAHSTLQRLGADKVFDGPSRRTHQLSRSIATMQTA